MFSCSLLGSPRAPALASARSVKYVVSCALDIFGARSGEMEVGGGVDICGELAAPADVDSPT